MKVNRKAFRALIDSYINSYTLPVFENDLGFKLKTVDEMFDDREIIENLIYVCKRSQFTSEMNYLMKIRKKLIPEGKEFLSKLIEHYRQREANLFMNEFDREVCSGLMEGYTQKLKIWNNEQLTN